MSGLNVQILGIPQAIAAMQGLTPALRVRHMRIALNAAVGVIRRRAVSLAPIDTKALSKSLRVKVIIPQSSRNPAHHDRPATGLVGAGRGITLAAVTRASGKRSATTFKAATASNARRAAKGQSLNRIQKKVPSRYIHLANRSSRFMESAATSGATEANTKFNEKIRVGIETEARRLASKP